MKLEDLQIYKKAHSLAVEIHKTTFQLPPFEMYEEGSQIRRSSKSICAQIVEGYSLRDYKKEYLHYLSRAYASCRETKEHLGLLFETRSLKDDALYEKLTSETEELSRMLYAFIDSVIEGHKVRREKSHLPSAISHLPSSSLFTQ